jgi:hypothetical protein
MNYLDLLPDDIMPIIRRRVDELYHEDYKYCELEKGIKSKYGNCVDVAFYLTNCEPCVSAKVFINGQINEIKISKNSIETNIYRILYNEKKLRCYGRYKTKYYRRSIENNYGLINGNI